MEKLKFIPHKNLFYIGFFIVIIFLLLSFWQFNRYKTNKPYIHNEINQIIINIDEVNEVKSNTFVKLQGTFILTDHYKLRSRVHNGESGYHIIAIYKQNQTKSYLIVNHGWVPLEKAYEIGTFSYSFDGFLIDYDDKSPIGQDDELGSSYLFRIDKYFIEKDKNIDLVNKYIHLSNNCGPGIECVDLNTGYKPPHLSYSFQWLFFAICLTIVILRKNKII